MSVYIHAEVCLGLYVLHTNKILHRDIKAANIFVGDNDCIKVCQSISVNMVFQSLLT